MYRRGTAQTVVDSEQFAPSRHADVLSTLFVRSEPPAFSVVIPINETCVIAFVESVPYAFVFQAVALQVYEDYFKDGLEGIMTTVIETLENRLSFYSERE